MKGFFVRSLATLGFVDPLASKRILPKKAAAGCMCVCACISCALCFVALLWVIGRLFVTIIGEIMAGNPMEGIENGTFFLDCCLGLLASGLMWSYANLAKISHDHWQSS